MPPAVEPGDLAAVSTPPELPPRPVAVTPSDLPQDSPSPREAATCWGGEVVGGVDTNDGDIGIAARRPLFPTR